MPEYALTLGAEQDLLEIARYTIRRWGPEQGRRYETALVSGFAAITRAVALEKPVFEHRQDFQVSRCEHHYIFFTRNEEGGVLILAVLHEKRDLIARFRGRLDAMERDD